jgi:hypothetical protein
VNVEFIRADLEADAEKVLRDASYALIVLVRYVNRILLPKLADALADGGFVLVEQHLATDEDVVGPRSPEHRYARNELLREALACTALRVLFYRENLVEDPDGRPAALAQLIACRGRGPF